MKKQENLDICINKKVLIPTLYTKRGNYIYKKKIPQQKFKILVSYIKQITRISYENRKETLKKSLTKFLECLRMLQHKINNTSVIIVYKIYSKNMCRTTIITFINYANVIQYMLLYIWNNK